jgi:peptidoglycan/xylan/chitin deacetylase (PgdA/CDA1 family)
VLPCIPENGNQFEFRNFVTTTQFEKQIKLLLKKYRPLKISDFTNPEGNIQGGFLITFDDGFRNNFKYAFPLLQKYRLQGCFFVTTDYLGSNEYIWTEQVTLLIQRTKKSKIELHLDKKYLLELNGSQKREHASVAIRRYLKKAPPSRVQEVLGEMKSQLNDVSLNIKEEDKERYKFMTWNEAKQMSESGQVIGSHTKSHFIVSTLSEEDSWEELKSSKEEIERNIGTKCISMSYPNGEREDYSETQKNQLQKLGYKCAFTQVPLFNSRNTDRFEIRRVNITSTTSMPVFEAKICGFK